MRSGWRCTPRTQVLRGGLDRMRPRQVDSPFLESAAAVSLAEGGTRIQSLSLGERLLGA